MTFKHNKINSTLLAISTFGLLHVGVPSAHAQIQSSSTLQFCDQIAVVGPSTPKNCLNSAGQYIDANGNISNVVSNGTGSVTATPIIDANNPSSSPSTIPEQTTFPVTCGGTISKNCYTKDDGFIDSNGVRHTLNSEIGLTETFSVLACENVAQNLMFKGQADYLQLWEPPQNTIGELSFAMEPRFNPTDLIYKNVNYGRGAVLLSNATKVNPRTGASLSMEGQPVVMNNCNITWVIPTWVYEELARRANEANGTGNGNGRNSGGAVLGPSNGGPDAVSSAFIGIDKDGYRRYSDGSYDANSSQEYRDYTIQRLQSNTEGGFGMGWNDMEWNAATGLWVPSGQGRTSSGSLY